MYHIIGQLLLVINNSYKGSRSILPQYNGSFIDALESLFKFDFDKTKFAVPWRMFFSNSAVNKLNAIL